MIQKRSNRTHIISLDTIIFVILALRYLISVGEKSPNPIFFSLLLLCIFIYVLIDYNPFNINLKSQTKSKTFAFFIITFILIYIPTIYLITTRHSTRNTTYTVDSAIQVEQSIKYLLSGVNPYSADYEPVLKDRPSYIDGTLYTQAYQHYVYLPFLTLINIPGYLLMTHLIGFFDLRMMSLVMLTLTIFLIFKFTKIANNKLIFLTLVLYNPIFLNSFLWGLNDVYVIFFVLTTIYMLREKHTFLAMIFLAFAATTKQPTWPLIPFIFSYLFLQQAGKLKDKFAKTVKKIVPFIFVTSMILVPFLLWDIQAFWQDIWLFISGGISTSTLIIGFGFSELLVYLDIVKSRGADFPFFILQFIIILTLGSLLIYLQTKKNSLGHVLINYLILLLPLWYFSRILNYNYLGYFSIILTLTFFIANDDPKIAK